MRNRWLAFAAMALVLTGLWELASALGWLSPLFFPPPTRILDTLTTISASGELGFHTMITLRRVAIGLLAGGAIGLLLGLTMGRHQGIRRLLDPWVAAAHPLPKIALLPLIMILFGIGETSKVIIVATVAFFPMLINTMRGVDQIPALYFEVAHNYGVSNWKMSRIVLIPGSLPFALAGLRLAVNSALVVAIAVEIVASQTGLGELIWRAWETFRPERLYATLLVITALGVFSNALVSGLTSILVPWQTNGN